MTNFSVTGKRTGCVTKLETDYDIEFKVIHKEDYVLLDVLNGVTGYESYRLPLDRQEEMLDKGFYICLGTPNKYDTLFIPADKVGEFQDKLIIAVLVLEELEQDKKDLMAQINNYAPGHIHRIGCKYIKDNMEALEELIADKKLEYCHYNGDPYVNKRMMPTHFKVYGVDLLELQRQECLDKFMDKLMEDKVSD